MKQLTGRLLVLTEEEAAVLYQAANMRAARVAHREGRTRAYEVLNQFTRFVFGNTANGKSETAFPATDKTNYGETWTIKDLESATGLAPRTIRLHIAKGMLPATKHGTTWGIPAREAKTYVKAHATQ
jgi:hypothetical protein